MGPFFPGYYTHHVWGYGLWAAQGREWRRHMREWRHKVGECANFLPVRGAAAWFTSALGCPSHYLHVFKLLRMLLYNSLSRSFTRLHSQYLFHCWTPYEECSSGAVVIDYWIWYSAWAKKGWQALAWLRLCMQSILGLRNVAKHG